MYVGVAVNLGPSNDCIGDVSNEKRSELLGQTSSNFSLSVLHG